MCFWVRYKTMKWRQREIKNVILDYNLNRNKTVNTCRNRWNARLCKKTNEHSITWLPSDRRWPNSLSNTAGMLLVWDCLKKTRRALKDNYLRPPWSSNQSQRCKHPRAPTMQGMAGPNQAGQLAALVATSFGNKYLYSSCIGSTPIRRTVSEE